jgi:chaperonin cofactor prefoldin
MGDTNKKNCEILIKIPRKKILQERFMTGIMNKEELEKYLVEIEKFLEDKEAKSQDLINEANNIWKEIGDYKFWYILSPKKRKLRKRFSKITQELRNICVINRYI